MDSRSDSLAGLTQHMRAFTEERGWGRHHTPKNLAMALAGEAGELVAEFQWLSAEASERSSLSADKLQAIESEMADVLIYLVQLADRLEVDLPEAAARKMERNATRFPIGGPNTIDPDRNR